MKNSRRFHCNHRPLHQLQYKTTFIPIHVDQTLALQMAQTLGTTISAFPQTYLGLPLSTHKVVSSDLVPLFSKAEKYLNGWLASQSAQPGGRLALMTSVLDNLPTHLMSCFPLDKQNIAKFNKKRRSFFWAVGDHCSGAQCLVDWDRVYVPKAAGGLGVKNLVTRNICLLLKFSYKFLHSNELSWKKWITQHSAYPLHHTSINTFLATIIKKNIHLLRQILAAPLEMALAPTSG